MNIILSGDLDPIKFESYRNILKVFAYAGHTCAIWFKNQKSVFDIFDELKPSIFISNELNPKEFECCEQYKTKFVTTTPVLAADMFQYLAPFEPEDLDKYYFTAKYCSIINHNQNEINHIKPFLNKGHSFKLFSHFRYSQKEYCGHIPENIFRSALGTAEIPLASNFLNMYNFTLLNPKTIYPLYSTSESYSRDRVLDEHTCFSCAKTMIEENKLQDICEMDIGGLFDKLRNEVGV